MSSCDHRHNFKLDQIIPIVGAVCDRAFFPRYGVTHCDQKDKRSQTAPTVGVHRIFLQSANCLAKIRMSELTSSGILEIFRAHVISAWPSPLSKRLSTLTVLLENRCTF